MLTAFKGQLKDIVKNSIFETNFFKNCSLKTDKTVKNKTFET